jgi:hypothetical protein
MKRKFLFICFICFILGAQNVYPQQWIRRYFPNRENYPHWVLESYDKGYVISGCFSQYSAPTWGLLIKTDINGYVRWFKSIGQKGDGTSISNVDRCNDGGLILGGATCQLEAWHDPLFLKLDKCGNKEWCKIYYTPVPNKVWDSYSQRIYQLPDGGYISLVLGYGSDMINKRIWLFMLDSLGDAIWIKYYQKPDTLMYNDHAYDMMVTDDYKFLITGTCDYPQPGTTLYWPRPFLIKTDSSGTTDWDLLWGVNFPYVLTGELLESVVDIKGKIYSCGLMDSLGRNPELYKTNREGSEIFHKILMDSEEFGNAGTIDWLQDSTLIVTGGWGDLATQTEGAFKTDTSGNILKVKELNNYDNLFVDGKTTFNNRIILVGGFVTDSAGNIQLSTYLYKINAELEFDSIYTRPFVYDSLCPDSIVSDTIPLDCEIVNIEEPFTNQEKSHLKIYPNPASDILTIEFPEYLISATSLSSFHVKTVRYQWSSTTLEAYDLSGRLVLKKEIPKREEKIQIDISGWQKGMYLFRLVYGNSMVASEKVIVK